MAPRFRALEIFTRHLLLREQIINNGASYLPPRFANHRDEIELLLTIPADLFNVPSADAARFQPQTHVDPYPYTAANYYSDAITVGQIFDDNDDVLVIEDASTSPRTTHDDHDHHQQHMIDGHSIFDLDVRNRNRSGGPPPVVLSEEAISKHMKTRAATPQDTTEICTVCQDDLHEQGKNESIWTLDCGHGYHADCIKTWLRQKNVCPLCNAIALVPDNDLFF